MIKRILAILFISIFIHTNSFAQFEFLFQSAPPEFTASEALTEILIQQTVSIFFTGTEGEGSCSGTIVHEDEQKQYILTAKHCIGVTEETYVEQVKALYIIVSPSEDLAVIVIGEKIPNKKVARIAFSKIAVNNIVHHVAYPSGVLYKASGKMTRVTDDWEWFDFRAKGGCSGGGIFDVSGGLVAVLWGGYNSVEDEAPMKTVAEPLKDIKAFLDMTIFNTKG